MVRPPGRSRWGAGRLAGIAVVAVGLLAGACGSGSAAPVGSRPATTTGAARPVGVEASIPGWHLPFGVSRAVAVAQGAEILVAGGLVTGDTSTSRVVAIDPASGTASQVGSLSEAVHDAGGAALAGGVVVFGGGAATTVAAVQRWSPQGGGHIVAALPRPRSDLAAVAIGDTAYVVGGFDGAHLTDAVLATSDGTAFRSVGSLCEGVRYPAVAALDGSVWVLGGQLGVTEAATDAGQSDDIQRFDPATGTCRVVGHLPVRLGHASALVLGGQLLVAGGRNGAVPTSQVWSIDPATGAVRAAGTLPAPRSDAAAVVMGGHALLIGGEGAGGPTEPLDTVVQLSLAR